MTALLVSVSKGDLKEGSCTEILDWKEMLEQK